MNRGHESPSPAALDRPVVSFVPFDRRTAVCLLVVAVLLVTRVWDLGNRAYCHDEATHAWEAWKLITGQRYVHDPVYHGPFLYHLTAFAYFLFGITDTTARLPAALLAVAAVLLVWPLRRWLGRPGALFAMALLTLSPTMMFRGRFIRHDIVVIVASMIMVNCFFRYLAERRHRWLYLTSGALALAFCGKANAFINGAIFGSFWVLFFGVQWLRRTKATHYSAVFDLVVLLATLALPQAAALFLRTLGFNPLDYGPVGLLRIRITILCLFGAGALAGVWWRRTVWPAAAAIFYSVFVPLYTTLFTNAHGLESGFMGMLGHWLSQQGVARGGQPWYYYFFLLAVYEFLPSLLTVLAVLYYLATARKSKPAGSAPTVQGSDTQRAAGVFVPFLLYWVVMNSVVFAWSGEKMPWQAQHIVLPLGLLGGWFLGQVWEATDWRHLLSRGWGQVTLLLPLAALALAVLWAAMVGAVRPFSGATLPHLEATLRWLVALAVLCMAVAAIIRYGRRLGAAEHARSLFALLIAALFILTARFAIMVSFLNQNYATEFLVYAAATPDTAAVMRELEEMARRLPGGEVLRIAYDDESQHPFFWYLRDRQGVTFFTATSGIPADQHVVIIGPGNEGKMKAQLVGQYLRRDYRRIWWPDESVYRNLTVAKLVGDMRDPARRRYWWDILWARKYPQPATLWPLVDRFALYVRRDVAARLWTHGADVQLPELQLPADEYEDRRVHVSADLQWGGIGNAPGQFRDPQGIAVDALGQVYVVDTGNHRVQVFDANGSFLRQWGTQGNGPGQLQEPWGIAVDGAGNVFVADTWNHRIQKFDSQGGFLLQWGTFGDTGGALGASNVFYGPRHVVVDAEGNVLVSDTGNKRIMRFTSEGEFVAQWGGGGALPGQFSEPVGLAVDAVGNILVADVWNQRIQRFDSAFSFLTQWHVVGWESLLPVNKPYVALDSQGNVYATVPEYHRVIGFDPDGQVLAIWGQFGTDGSSLNVPTGLAVDGEDDLYVIDSGNHRVMRFAPIR